MKKVTLYIPCPNAAHFLDRVLPAVKVQTWPIEELLIVDDDASTDNTREVVRHHAIDAPFPIRMVSAGRHTGLASARNVAVREAGTDYLAALDADCAPEPLWLEYLMENFTSDDIAGACGQLVEKEIHGSADRWRAVHLPAKWADEKVVDPPFLFGHGNVFRVRDILAVGGYDEMHKRAGEDNNISQKLKEKGYKLIYDPRAICGHLRTDSIASLMKTTFNYNNWHSRKGLRNTLSRMVSYLRVSCKYIAQDISRRQWSLLPVSTLYLFWMIKLELGQRVSGHLK